MPLSWSFYQWLVEPDDVFVCSLDNRMLVSLFESNTQENGLLVSLNVSDSRVW